MSVLEAMVGLIAPPDCLACGAEGSALCTACSTSGIKAFGERCWRCNKLSPRSKTCENCRHTGSPGRVWISTNYEALAQELVRVYKFGHLRTAADTLAGIMADTYQQIDRSEANYIIVPVPTATSRMRQRGFGHSELLAKKVAARLRFEYSPALRRLGQSRQLGAKRQDRLTQLTGSFAVKNPKDIRGQRLLLVDDVLTTGGTLIAATQALRAAGTAQVDALLFAKRL